MYGIINYEVFLLTGILLNLIPGADTMYIVGRSISQGRKAGMYSVFGIITGSLVHTLLVAFGLSIILTKSIVLFNTIKVIGVIYLVYLGIKMILDKTNVAFQVSSNKLNIRKIYIQGLLTSLTNPKVSLFFIAFLPQFIDTKASGPMPFIILGLTFTVTGLLWCLFVAYFSSYVTKKLRGNQKVGMILNKITGLIFIGMGLKLLQTKAPQ
ncbi:LysE family translocator [Bacillus cereus]|uniref:LysE family translocator n=5 Tax=Bacillales TaxID=1385 RepID=A0A643MJB8_BACTU|nr:MULTISPECIES: LysE family translocator [Bacillus cereus group]AGE76700.1 Homoserine/homoserine lactone efflux protein [Bacillus thuringiensis serovar kurstaki str. HD73]AHZ49871.1 amino acid transporter LysE [Bacillus thuringiensis serovar kurstaki str. YBT-1520]AIE32244.1 amino acid transporter LysE [Bacillus thuringiensis serovar kurstaki str. HD-1]AIM33549.1 homoserine/homoserine lactone efflux protein [Bacillus thuringiensis serovar kurstaki str. YBT-1520]AJK42065.1 lysE type translocat